MENQIQLYHNVTAFWLDKQWKTPREKELEKENTRLNQEINSLKAQIGNLEAQNRAYQGELRLLRVFRDIPCDKCGKPMSNEWTRNQVLKAFANWGHSSCHNR